MESKKLQPKSEHALIVHWVKVCIINFLANLLLTLGEKWTKKLAGTADYAKIKG
jgi:hypothetical protein